MRQSFIDRLQKRLNDEKEIAKTTSNSVKRMKRFKECSDGNLYDDENLDDYQFDMAALDDDDEPNIDSNSNSSVKDEPVKDERNIIDRMSDTNVKPFAYLAYKTFFGM